LRRPGEPWSALKRVYRRAIELHELLFKLQKARKNLEVAEVSILTPELFQQLWNVDGLNRLDYYASDLERALRVADWLPVPPEALWPEMQNRWEAMRGEFRRTLDALEKWQRMLNTRFQDLMRQHYSQWIMQADAPFVFTHQFLPRLLKAYWDPRSGRKAVILVFDGLRTEAWDEFLRPVFEERFQVVQSLPGCSLLPSETQISRKAISGGGLPEALSSANELMLLKTWLKRELGIAPDFAVLKDDDTVASGISVRYNSDLLDYVVFDFTDHALHNNRQDLAFIYDTTVREIIRQDVRSILRSLPPEVMVFCTSDHGFAPMPQDGVVIRDAWVADPRDVKYRSALATARPKAPDDEHLVIFDARMMGLRAESDTLPGRAVSHVLFPRPGYVLQREGSSRGPDRYGHGGISLGECLVPMVVLGPQPASQPMLGIQRVRQVGAMIEGEAVTLEITLVPLRIGLGDIAVTLSFSRDEIPVRREVLAGDRAATYRVSWVPSLGEITSEDRRHGECLQDVTVIVSFRGDKEQALVRLSSTAQVRIKLDPARLHRRVDSKLDLMMGRLPDSLKS